MPLIRVSLSFMEMKDKDLDDLATKVAGLLTTNAGTFGTLPVTVVSLTAAQGAFHISLSNAKGAGKAATADKDAKRATLIGLLRTLALFIQGKTGLTESDVDLSGFTPIVSGPHAPVNVDTPVIGVITNVAPGKLGVKVTAPDGFKSLEFRTTVGTAAPVRCGTFPSTRGVVLEDLPSLQSHAVQCRAVFGGNRFSEWSDPVSHTTT